MEVTILSALADNYVYLITHEEQVAVVDPSEAKPVLQYLERHQLHLTHILNTHHHWDHTDGNLELQERYDCEVYGSLADQHRIPGITRGVKGGESVQLGGFSAKVIEIPGHTSGHIAFWFSKESVVFTGDTLFSLGCGRMFEGTPEQLWSSLCRLRELPDSTKVYCGHEYTIKNAQFSLGLDPDNEDLRLRFQEAQRLRDQNQPTLPVPLGTEKKTNPFLRADDISLAKQLGREGKSPVEVFADLRKRRDQF